MAHLTVAAPNIAVERYAADIIGPMFHVQHALKNPWNVKDGQIALPQGPGLGIELDRDQLAALRTVR